MSVQRAKQIAEIKSGLQSGEDVLIHEALGLMEKKGDASLLADVIHVWAETEDFQLKKKAENLLFSLKEKGALEELVRFIGSNENEEKNWVALNAIWQSGFNATEFLSELIDFALKGSYLNAVDIMTIVDNSDFDQDSEAVVDANIQKITQFLQDSKSEVAPILSEIRAILIDKKIEG
jgi:hypothetical protein